MLLIFFYLCGLWSLDGPACYLMVLVFRCGGGIPVLALALFGCWLGFVRHNREGVRLWWTLMFAGSLCCFQLAPISWNPRYFLFFLPPLWVLAAYSMEFVAQRVGYRTVGAACTAAWSS